MKTLIPAFLSVVAFAAPAATQDPAGEPAPAPALSEAERLFRDAWWAETGKSDLETALRGYLAAAAAEGPASVRAKALLHAAGAQHRLGKADQALDLYRKILAEYATEKASVEQARVHLRELTAVDLRQNYDEWYERRLFSEEIQLLILGKLEALTSMLARRPADNHEVAAWHKGLAGLEAEIVAFGKGAVPGLQKACLGGHYESRGRAIELLFSLGELPPASALLASDGWLGYPAHWSTLVSAITPPKVPAAPAWHRPFVAAAVARPNTLLEQLLASRDANLIDRTEIVSAITVALLQHRPSVDATLAAIQSPATPTRLRPAMERAVLDSEESAMQLTATQWVALSEDPLQFELRLLGTRRAASLVGKADEVILETLLQRAEKAGEAAPVFVYAITSGLGRLVAPLDVPWTAARLRRLILLGQRKFDGNLVEALLPLHTHTPARAMLAEAMLAEPAAFAAAITAIPQQDRTELPLFEQVAFPNGNERDVALFIARWHAALLAVLEGSWSQWDDGNRAAAVSIVQQALLAGSFDAMRAFLEGKMSGAAQPVRAAIEELFAKRAG
ncbi:MAG TPA: hypothetical protein VF384_19080 [Planctomycetota bacterium]